jgi:hypothetical protein
MVVETGTWTLSGRIVVLFRFVRASAAQAACKRGSGCRGALPRHRPAGSGADIKKTVKLLKERKIACRTLRHPQAPELPGEQAKGSLECPPARQLGDRLETAKGGKAPAPALRPRLMAAIPSLPPDRGSRMAQATSRRPHGPGVIAPVPQHPAHGPEASPGRIACAASPGPHHAPPRLSCIWPPASWPL